MNCNKSKTVVILSSRQSMFPSGNNLWVKNSQLAIKWIKENNHILLSSTGMSTWDLVTVLGQHYKIPMTLYVPAYDMADYRNRKTKIINDFELDFDLVSFYPVYPDSEKSDKKYFLQKRDHIISETADIIVPVSFRMGGNISNIINQNKNNKEINLDFITRYDNRRKVPVYKFEQHKINSQILDFNENYFIHWTRTFNKSWPDESRFKYYCDIANNDHYPRSAFETLDKIINSKKIIASDKNMPENRKTVSFSALTPIDIIPLIRWRARFKQFSFEPYGIGIKKEIAIKYNIQPVIYYNKQLPIKVDSDKIYLTQSIGKVTDWRHEKELRHESDFDFSKISKNDLVLFCYTKDEAIELENKFGIKTISFIVYN